jgi:hypothetical protein
MPYLCPNLQAVVEESAYLALQATAPRALDLISDLLAVGQTPDDIDAMLAVWPEVRPLVADTAYLAARYLARVG